MLTTAGVVSNFAIRVGNELRGNRAPMLMSVIASAVGAKSTTREFQFALDGARENAAKAKRWIDIQTEISNRELLSSVFQKIKFSLEPEQIIRPPSAHSDSYSADSINIIRNVSEFQRKSGSILAVPERHGVKDAIYTIKLNIHDIENESLRDQILSILNVLEFSLSNIEIMGPSIVASQTAALIGALVPVVPKEPMRRKRLMEAVGVIGTVHLALVGINGTISETKAMFKNLSDAASLMQSININAAGKIEIGEPPLKLGHSIVLALPAPPGMDGNHQ